MTICDCLMSQSTSEAHHLHFDEQIYTMLFLIYLVDDNKLSGILTNSKILSNVAINFIKIYILIKNRNNFVRNQNGLSVKSISYFFCKRP